MIKFLKTITGKVAALLVLYIPFFSAVFFNFFDGEMYESPIGGCCLSMEGVVATGYALFTMWILVPIALTYIVYRLTTKFMT